ncbi:MAG: branched-chain amino acid ABC transporter permease [Pseudomonadota bacterium]
MGALKYIAYIALLAGGIAAPFIFPTFISQISVLWVMVLLALTWDLQGGQMGYNSLGNIFFFGFGMYVSAVVQIGIVYDVGEYTSAFGGGITDFTPTQYYMGIGLGLLAAGILSAISAYILGWVLIGLRGPYFAIGTLGVAIAAGELFGAWDWVGGGSGISMPVYPGDPDAGKLMFYMMNFALACGVFAMLAWLYSTRFGLAINAIRDDEEKAEGMGLHTKRYKRACWAVSAFFLGISGAIFGNMIGFIEPLEVAFQTINFGIFMVLMVLLGGKGTLWGPVIGAVLFHAIKEVTWTYLLGTQWVALGVLIVIIVVFFQQGIVGWLMEKRPHWFGIVVDRKEAQA